MTENKSIIKKIIIAIVLIVLVFAGLFLRSYIVYDRAPYRLLPGEWKAVAVIHMNKIEDIDKDITCSIDRKGDTGNVVFTDETGTTEYSWVYEGMNIYLYSYEYTLDEYTAISAENKEGFILCRRTESGIHGTIFVKAENADQYDKFSDFETLLDLDLHNEVIDFMNDEEAVTLIEGIWEGSRYEENGDITLLYPGAVMLKAYETSYEVVMVDEVIPGLLSYAGMVNGIHMYNLDGGYEDCTLAYDEQSESLVLYEEASDIGIVFSRY